MRKVLYFQGSDPIVGKWHFHGGKIHDISPVVETTSTRISGMKGVVSKETVVLSRRGSNNHQFHKKKKKKKKNRDEKLVQNA